jgi:hypothetical protein
MACRKQDPQQWFLSHSQGGEAQATETIGDELKAPKANGFTEGKAIARQVLTASSGDERR